MKSTSCIICGTTDEFKWSEFNPYCTDCSDKMIGKLKEILRAAGLEMNIWSCGCCDSPVISLRKDGEIVFADLDDAELEMIPQEELPEWGRR